jgi:PilZ domain
MTTIGGEIAMNTLSLIKRENERRNKFRFAMERDVRYKMADEGVVLAAGTGRTLDIGSGGVSFATEQPLEPGGYVELSISWPLLLNETCPIRLVVFGRILRCTRCVAVCKIDKYEFRTQARTVQLPSTTRVDSMFQRWVIDMRKGSLRTSTAGV